jgi:hypothetical protein
MRDVVREGHSEGSLTGLAVTREDATVRPGVGLASERAMTFDDSGMRQDADVRRHLSGGPEECLDSRGSLARRAGPTRGGIRRA